MSNITSLPGADHDEIRRLLPWRLTERLDGAEKIRVDAHLAACPDCRMEFEAERRLRAEILAVPQAMERDWLRMRSRIAASPRARPARREPKRARVWIGLAVAAQAAILALLATDLAFSLRRDGYRTLATPPAASARIIVTFDPQIREQAVLAILRSANARVTDGPTASGAFVLEVPAAARAKALADLRAHAAVTLAESLDGDSPR